jgi:TRAP-type C4-dicarboxylate transport system permease small subunit
LAATSHAIEIGLLWACGALLLLLTANIFLEVLIRFVVRIPLPWTEEVARFAMVWLAILAAAAAARRGLHFSFRWGVMMVGATARRHLRLCTDLLVAGILLVLLVQSNEFLDIVADQTATATGIDMRIPYAGLPVGMGAFLLITLLEIADAVLAFWTGQRLSIKEAAETRTEHDLRHPEHAPNGVPLPSAE